ncbi:hypothetical protein FTUN_7348 [Frigoriglobus tundricola]|uniref:Uncharacterized protein n=1 Tax=Frigoriglobus tundricola TaxID=2774151 RepID=A0A6M5Z0M4_9BACT|nr:hypothetical protein FTUN_7348 [Frigoriglobus tundricola]
MPWCAPFGAAADRPTRNTRPPFVTTSAFRTAESPQQLVCVVYRKAGSHRMTRQRRPAGESFQYAPCCGARTGGGDGSGCRAGGRRQKSRGAEGQRSGGAERQRPGRWS